MATDAGEATESRGAARRLWHGVLKGDLVVERHFDRGGRRYLVLQQASRDRSKRDALSPREREVVSYRAYGQSLKLIAGELGVSVPTVQRALVSGLKKLGLSGDLELAAVFGAGLRGSRNA
ncbi:MAG TPA: LuxR C-terminal-related transcriptional regulator [Polyangiaceae bacterium]|jgi:DNA-binding CsgD family transcriptional regulator|nr:LuxR C-terminal-related transcriptional regulator [Polyangiaceae bacterium]